MTCSILIVAEGAHELSGGQKDAALPTPVRRILADGIEVRFHGKRISQLKRRIHPGRGDRLGKKFIGIVQLAEDEGFDAAVIVIDHDGDGSRLKSATFAQQATVTSFPRAIGIAERTFEAWILADQIALAKTLSTNVDMQPDPESIPHPKAVCQNLNNSAGGDWRLRDLYAEVAAVANLQTLGERCPAGFAVFAARVEELKPALMRASK